MRTKEEYDAYIAHRNLEGHKTRTNIICKILSLYKSGSHECFYNVEAHFEYAIRNYFELYGIKTNTIKRSEIGSKNKVLLHFKWGDNVSIMDNIIAHNILSSEEGIV